jgi:Zn-dependent M28 family amino/carboxypeptidase
MRKRILIGIFVVFCSTLLACFSQMVSMPGTSYAKEIGVPSSTLESTLRTDVTHLAVEIGERNIVNAPASLDKAREFISARLKSFGYEVKEESFVAQGHSVSNLIAEKKGAELSSEIVVLGAHYDTAPGTPGADDNGSGVASALALAETFSKSTPRRTLRFVFFTNEEPPFFNTENMGSEVNAQATRKRNENVVAMISLETMGHFQDAKDSQHYPFPISIAYPSTGNFVAFVGDTGSRQLVRDSIEVFRTYAKIPSEGASVPAAIQGADWSDHGPYWRAGYRAFMVTDTAPFRNQNYHEKTDLPGNVDFRRLALVVEGLVPVLEALVNPK